jgi:hypothetical protein
MWSSLFGRPDDRHTELKGLDKPRRVLYDGV